MCVSQFANVFVLPRFKWFRILGSDSLFIELASQESTLIVIQNSHEKLRVSYLRRVTVKREVLAGTDRCKHEHVQLAYGCSMSALDAAPIIAGH